MVFNHYRVIQRLLTVGTPFLAKMFRQQSGVHDLLAVKQLLPTSLLPDDPPFLRDFDLILEKFRHTYHDRFHDYKRAGDERSCSLGWSWARSIDRTQSGKLHRAGFRAWGYVMWDESRLNKMKILNIYQNPWNCPLQTSWYFDGLQDFFQVEDKRFEGTWREGLLLHLRDHPRG